MTAANKDRKTPYQEGQRLGLAVAAASKIYTLTFVCVNTAGYAVPGVNTAGFKLGGVAEAQCDNSAGANGAKYVEVRRRGVFQFAAAGLGIGHVGRHLWLADDQTVQTDPTNVYAGRLAYFISATVAPVAVNCDLPAPQPFIVTLPLFTGWVKNGADQDIVLPPLKIPTDYSITRAYAHLGTAPGAGKTLGLKLRGSAAITIAGAATMGANEALAIDWNRDSDLGVMANETAGGLGANAEVQFLAYPKY